ncbi:MAG: family 78 glycoside hydrolase catalytic domain [Lachnospiraceae bacterium]|nr:family 78 glycoside hydrolase catalytic domain [Lachnospiraceae bacterium]
MMKKRKNVVILFIVLILLIAVGLTLFYMNRQKPADTTVQRLTVNRRENPVGVPVEEVSFGWQMQSTENGKMQSAYRIVVADTEEALQQQKYVWDSGKVESEISVYIPYEGEALENSERYYWNVQVWDEDGKLIEEAETAYFDTCAEADSWKNIAWISTPVEETDGKETVTGEIRTAEEFYVSYDMWMEQGKSSFVFGANQGEYGHLYRVEWDTTQEYLIHRLAEVQEKQVVWEEETKYKLLSADCIGQEMHVQISVQADKVITYLNGEAVAENQIQGTALIGYGFYQERGTVTAYYDNLVIENGQKEVIAKETFENPKETIFSPYQLDIEEGKLRVRHQYVLADIRYESAPMLRKEFEVDKEVENAYLYAASVGVYEPFINGNKVGNSYFASGRQAYREQMKYDSYDITNCLTEGKNAIGVYLGHGWYDRAGYRNEGELGFKAQLVICYTDGTKEMIATDDTWQCYTDGPIRNDDMYNGEFYDAGKEQEGWNTAGFAAEGWQSVACDIVQNPDMEFLPNEMERIECVQTLVPVSVTEPEEGVFVYDFGQEFSGNVKLSGLQGNAGDCITIQYGEALNAETMSVSDDTVGTVWNDNYLMAQNTDYYVMSGDSEEYTPTLVCRAFRYVQIEGLSEALEPEQVEGLVLSTAMEETGSFTTSNGDLNKLYENIVWTQRSNYLDIPTDCPQRDERLGWSGDAQIFARSAAYNSDTYHFMDNYLYYLREAQTEEGAYPDIVPYRACDYGNNGWADAGITITWYHYLQYGDKQIILDNYEAMCRYVDYLVATSENYIRTKQGYGDHNSISETPREVTNTALCAYVSGLMADMAQIIGKEDDAAYFDSVYNEYKNAWQTAFVQENGSVECWTQAAYTLGLQFDLFDEKKEMAAEHLVTCVDYTDTHLNTGYIGTQFILPILVDNGKTEKAYGLLEQTTYPSWLYQVQNGATTVYERWNGYQVQEDGTYLLQGSLNHCGLGSVNEFLFRYVLGIEADSQNPGFKHIILQPTIGGSLTYAKGSYKSIYGTIVSEWEKNGAGVTYHTVIPANTTATLILPNGETMELESGEHTIQLEL